MDTLSTVETKINGLYPVRLLPHRVEFHAERPWWEASRLASMAELVKPGWTIYDVGAEEGDFTALYRTWVGDDGRIVAVEPSPGYWPAIRQTWEGNEFGALPVCVVGFASSVTAWPDYGPHWGAEQERRILSDGSGWPACSDGVVIPDAGFRHLAQQTADTPQWRLDQIALYGEPDGVVLDIEGAEYDALVGMSGLLRPGAPQPVVWVSVHDIGDDTWPGSLKGWYGKTVDDIHALMDGFGYRWELLDGNGEGERFFVYTPA